MPGGTYILHTLLHSCLLGAFLPYMNIEISSYWEKRKKKKNYLEMKIQIIKTAYILIIKQHLMIFELKYLLKIFFLKSLRLCVFLIFFGKVVLRVISPISIKLCQFKGSTPKLKKAEQFLVWFFPGGDKPPPGFSWFSTRKSPQNR